MVNNVGANLGAALNVGSLANTVGSLFFFHWKGDTGLIKILLLEFGFDGVCVVFIAERYAIFVL